jgi:signal peptide peptidase SppA
VQDGVAIIPLEGVIAKRMNLFSRISGGVSTQLFQRDLAQALNDEEVRSIILLVDSPGGSVDGTQAAAHAVRAGRDRKPIVVLADGLMASAAYWIGSAASQIFISDDTTVVGSIGVLAEHVDWSKYEDSQGYKVTEITAGKYKRIASEHAPLSLEGAASIQDQVDTIYSIFVNDVAANRGKSAEEVLNNMADGRIFIGQKAITAGLADGVKSLSDIIEMLNSNADKATNLGAKVPKTNGGIRMDKVLILGVTCTTQAEVDKAVEALVADTKAQTITACHEVKEKAVAAARQGERERILAIQGNSMAGHEKLVAEMVADGKTSGPESAQRILAAEKGKTAQVAADLAADAPNPALAAPADNAASNEKKDPDAKQIAKDAQTYVESEAKEGRKISYSQAVSHVMQQKN